MGLVNTNNELSVEQNLPSSRESVHRTKYSLNSGVAFFNQTGRWVRTTSYANLQAIKNLAPKNQDERNHSLQSYSTVMGIILISGTILFPYFHVGLLIGVASFLIKILLSLALRHFLPSKKSDNGTYMKLIKDNPYYVSLTGPILEELLFRGCMQPLLIHLFSLFIPASATIFVLPGLSAAALTSVLITSVTFGMAHTQNDHSGAIIQGVITTLSGVIQGLLCVYFGLPTAIAAHIANNSLSTHILMSNDHEPTASSQKVINIPTTSDEPGLEINDFSCPISATS